MTSVVLDASAILALIRDEAGADQVAGHIGRAAVSAVNLQEVIGELLASGLDEATIRELLDELRLDIRAHDSGAAYAAAALHAQTGDHGYGLGDRSCLALALHLGIPVLTANRDLKKLKVKGLKIEVVG
jgi:PIN domain nuclease of toxin-antitoxin system